MSETPARPANREETPVDDVRRVRCRLSREAGGDIHKLIESANRVADQYREQLGLKPAIASGSQPAE